jgi:hypothetical protein
LIFIELTYKSEFGCYFQRNSIKLPLQNHFIHFCKIAKSILASSSAVWQNAVARKEIAASCVQTALLFLCGFYKCKMILFRCIVYMLSDKIKVLNVERKRGKVLRFLGAFYKLGKATFNYVMSVCLSVCLCDRVKNFSSP